MKKYIILIIPVLVLAFMLSNCKKDDSNPVVTDETTMPVIKSLTADKNEILSGGADAAIITCVATGGNLTYTWEVDLGDIIPKNNYRSVVSFTGAACCVGEKTIKCTVSNDKGSVSKTIVIKILEQEVQPEIINVETDKNQLSLAANETANIVCYAVGGNLSYKWEAGCGNITFKTSDSSKITYTPAAQCIGKNDIKCTVTNKIGTVQQSVAITVIQ